VPEEIFNDRYQIVRHIARGGMAQVYLAQDLLLDRPVALKVLFAELAANRSFVERFRREARAAANLNHPNIVAVYDWGEQSQTYFIVMEYLEGQTLRELILRNRRIPPRQAAEIGAEIAAALAFAHHHGVIHRDVKPGNVIISPNGLVKVTDFGIARAGDPNDNLTQTGAVMGTATYFSPEQAQGKPLDNRSDLYSLGVVLYEMVSGNPPFTGENPVAIAYQHVRELPAPFSQLKLRVPAPFEAIVAKTMAKDPAARYANAEDLRADLLRFREGKTVKAAGRGTRAAAAAGAASTAVAAQDTAALATRVGGGAEGTQVLSPTAVVAATHGPPRRTGAYIALLVILLAALGVLLFLLARSLGVGDKTTSTFTLPSVLGKNEVEATRILEGLGLRVEKQQLPNQQTPAGNVFDQSPPPSAKVAKGDTVTLKVSQGPATDTVPDVTGQTFEQASRVLQSAGFKFTIANRPFNDAPEGEVVEQSPRGGTKAEQGSTVRLAVSRGPAPTTTEATSAPTTTERTTTTRQSTTTTFPTTTTTLEEP
jgi:eukaryotic-like serine/threonine-protein kinase